MKVGLISGSGSHEWPGLVDPSPRRVRTAYGEVDVTDGSVAGVEVVHLSRHGAGHVRLSHQVTHRANLAALLGSGVDALISLTVCGAVDPSLALGSLVVFDDLYFPSNRLPDGTPCTWYDQPGAQGRGHWIYEGPFSRPVRDAVLGAAAAAASALDGVAVATSGCYGHVDGPRFNTRSEIAVLATAGVTAVSQTAGPEVVLAGEAELPMALVGYLTDYANGVSETTEPVEALIARMAASTGAFATLVAAALPALGDLEPAGVVYRFGT